MPITIQPATLKYKNGQGQFQSADCIKGDPGRDGGDPTVLIDDTAGTGVTNKTWSANKITTELGNLPDPTSVINDSAGPRVSNKTWSAEKLSEEFAGKADLDLIAPDGAGLTFPILAGQYFTLGGTFYKAILDIEEDSDFDSSHMEAVVVGEELSDVKSAITNLETSVFDRSANLYNPELQTPDTISPHYYVDGAPYSSTEFDGTYNCTALIPVKPNTTYTVGLVPAYNNIVNPWNTASQRGWSFDKDGNYIAGSNWTSNTFTTSSNAAYIRFNYAKGFPGINLSVLNEYCMLVEGDTLPSTHEEYRNVDRISDLTERMDAAEEEIETVGAKTENVSELLDERTLYFSDNLYNPALQTSETISPHYYVNGVPYSSTQFDSSYHCSGPIQVKPNTQYTIGLIPGFTSSGTTYTVPWGNLGQSVFYYDENGDYISRLTDSGGTFTTPSNAKYIRFNFFVSGLGLNNLNSKCVMVLGQTLPESYIAYAEKTIKEEIADVDAKTDGFAEDIAEAVETSTETEKVMNLLLGDHEVIRSANLYNPALQTSETISPHYYVNGVPYSSTHFDSSYNCTAPIEIESNTQYTVGLVPPVGTNEIVKPWYTAAYGAFFYDSNGDYISGSSNNTFTTPSNAKTMRFNYYISHGTVSLNVLNASCMLVKGSTLPETYQAYGDKLVSDLQTMIDNLGGIGFEYKFYGTDVLVSYGYNNDYDAVVVMNEGRANGLFDFAKLCLKPKGNPLSDYETSGLTVVWSSGTDMHGPFQFNAVNNADGYHYDNNDPGFVGGNHTLDQLGSDFKTATSKYVRYYADGRPVSSGYGYCMKFEVRWANDVQAYNTVKEGGGGRACLTEYHDMIFDGVQFNEVVKLVPLENINMRLWYGFQFVSWGTKYTNLRFLDGANRCVYTSGNVSSGNLHTRGMEAYGNNDMIVLTVDTGFDLGKRDLVGSGYDGAFTSGSKGYFRIITKGSTFVMNEGDAYYLKGSFRFCPAITATT